MTYEVSSYFKLANVQNHIEMVIIFLNDVCKLCLTSSTQPHADW